MVAEIKPRLVATNVIFIIIVVSLLTIKYWFSRLRLLLVISFYTANKICYLQISIFYKTPRKTCPMD